MDFLEWYLFRYSKLLTDFEVGEDGINERWNELQKKYREEVEKNLVDNIEKEIDLNASEIYIIENALRLYVHHLAMYQKFFYDLYYGNWDFVEKEAAENVLKKIERKEFL